MYPAVPVDHQPGQAVGTYWGWLQTHQLQVQASVAASSFVCLPLCTSALCPFRHHGGQPGGFEDMKIPLDSLPCLCSEACHFRAGDRFLFFPPCLFVLRRVLVSSPGWPEMHGNLPASTGITDRSHHAQLEDIKDLFPFALWLRPLLPLAQLERGLWVCSAISEQAHLGGIADPGAVPGLRQYPGVGSR